MTKKQSSVRPSVRDANEPASRAGVRSVLATAVMVSLLVLAGCGSGPLSEEQLMERALQFEAAGDLRAAEIEWKNLLQRNPAHGEARLRLGLVNIEMGQFVAARMELQRAAELGQPAIVLAPPLAWIALLEGEYTRVLDMLDPETFVNEEPARKAEVLLLRSEALAGLGRTGDAVASVERALELAPDFALAQVARAALELRDGRVADARARLVETLAAHPDVHQGWSLLGDLERGAGNLAEAETAFSRVIETHPDGFAALMQRALVRLSRGDIDGAERDLAAMQRLAPEEPRTAYIRGLVHFQHARHAEAQSAFEEVLVGAPNQLAAHFFLGAAHFAQGRTRVAEHHLEHFLRENPGSIDAVRLLAQVHLSRGDFDQAEALLERLLAQQPDDEETLRLVRAVHGARGDYASPAGQLHDDEAVGPSSRTQVVEAPAASRYLLEGRAHSASGRHEDAVAAFERAHALAPSQEAAVALGLALQQVERAQEAAEMLRSRLAQYPDETAVRLTLAQALLSLGENAAAIREYENLVRTLPEHAAVLNNLAYLYHAEGDARALEYAERAHAQAPDNPAVADTLGWILVERGDVARGLPLLATAREAFPEHPEVRYHFAVALAKAGRRAEAQQELEALLETFESFPQRADAQRMLSQLR